MNKQPITYWKPSSLSVMVPAYNEQENLKATVESLFKVLNITVEDFEIIIINDGSTDDTGNILKQLVREYPEIQVHQNQKRIGFGACYIQGFKIAKKDYFVFIPADNTLPQRSMVDLFGNIGKAKIIVTYPLNPEVRHWTRKLFSRYCTILVNFLFHRKLHHYHGFNIFPIEFLRLNPITTPSFGFQHEMLLKALAIGLSYYEVGIQIDKRHSGHSKAIAFKNLSQALMATLRAFWDLQITKNWQKQVANQTRPRRTMSMFPENTPPMNIVITGAGSGIGAALTRALSKAGHQLFICGRNQENLIAVSQNMPLTHTFPCDVTQEQDVKKFIAWIQTQVPTIDAVIHCAGCFGAIGPIAETNAQEWLETLKVNVFGPYLISKYLLPLLEQSSNPQIITFSGGGAFNPFPHYSAYATSKAALIRFTETLAAELAPKGIMVNAIAPGFLLTPAHEATLKAGIQKSGHLQYRRTQALFKEGNRSIERVIECIQTLLTPAFAGLTGKTISVNFDPWDTEAFKEYIFEIARSDLYTMRRMNLVNLPIGYLKTNLSNAWNHGNPQRFDEAK